MKKTIALLIFLTGFPTLLKAQQGFEKVYGGSANDMLRAICIIDDTSLIAAGFTESFGSGTVNNPDFYVVKMNFSGDTIWTRSFGSTSPDYAYAVTAFNDGYVIAGEAINPDNYTYDFFAVKTDFNGNLMWENYYGASGGDYCVSALTTSANRLLLAGSTNSNTYGSYDYYLVETDAEGNQLANEHYGGMLSDMLKKVIPTNDNGYLLIGNSNSFTTNFDVYIVKVDSNLTQQWSQTFAGPDTDYGYDAIQDGSDNFYILVNQPTSSDSGFIKLIKTDAAGLNAITYPVLTHAGDYGYGMTAVANGFLITGYTSTFAKGSEVLLIKTDFNGDTLWSNHFGGVKNEVAFSVLTTDSGDIIIAGESEGFGVENFDAYVIKVDSNGNVPCPDQVSFTTSDSALCEDQIVYFTNTTVSSTTFNWKLDSYNFSQAINTAFYFNDAGSYVVSLSACSAESNFPLEIFIKPPSLFTYSSAGNTVTFLLTNSLNASSFSWDFGDGTLPETSVLNPSHSYINQGNYWVSFSAIDEHGCDSTFTMQIEVVTSAENLDHEAEMISIWPNPVHHHGYLLSKQYIQFPVQAIIYDLEGRKLMQFPVKESKQEFSVESLPPGIFLLTLKKEQQSLAAIPLIVE